MLKRSWVFIAAFGLAITVSGQAYSQEEYGQDGAPEEQEQSESPTFSIPVQIIESQEAAIARDSSEREAEEREIHDLIAQQGMREAADAMNSATEDMALYSLISTITVIVGTGLLFWTLALTRQANRAARDAVDVTREIGEAQVRAYVTWRPVHLNVYVPDMLAADSNINTPIEIHSILENSGNSPAYDVRTVTHFHVTDTNDMDNANGIEIIEHNQWLSDTVAANGVLQKCTTTTLKVAPILLTSGQNIINIIVRIDYKDVFGKQQSTLVGGYYPTVAPTDGKHKFIYRSYTNGGYVDEDQSKTAPNHG